MLTARGWWCLFSVVLLLVVGVLRGLFPVTVTGLALLLWFGWEWLLFGVRAWWGIPGLRVRRELLDERGPVNILWEGRVFRVRITVREGEGWGSLSHAQVTDPVPFAVEFVAGTTSTGGPLQGEQGLTLEYVIRCPEVGVARFEGVRIEAADLQGFFYFKAFLRSPLEVGILPRLLGNESFSPWTKGHNQLLPPGIHRLRNPGTGSELLDLRDYQPGDPPRTIAWKVSARRDRLITREYESEVPVRCTLFLDASNSVRVPSPPPAEGGRGGEHPPRNVPGKALDGLIRLACGVVQACTEVRDLIGVCIFDEQGVREVRPARGPAHQTRLLRILADAACMPPTTGQADPDVLTPLAYSLAEDLYPELLRDSVNHVPGWVVWFAAFPGNRRRWRGWLEMLHRRKRLVLLWGTTIVPLMIFLLELMLLVNDLVPTWARDPGWVVLALLLSPLATLGAWGLFLLSLLVSGRLRRLARWRKKLAALLSVRYGLDPGGLALLLEDDDSYSLYLQKFLAEHQVPFALPLYDEQGRYLFRCPGKVPVLASALTRAVGRGRDNELFVLVVDLLELDDQLLPLLQAVRLAQARHHQVVIVCPWPPGISPPGQPAPGEAGLAAESDAGKREAARQRLLPLLGGLARSRFAAAWQRIRRTFVRLGVTMVYATSEEAMPLILSRIDRLRQAARNT
jgi:uncharacterized protein (DUF58 family)